MEFIKNITNRSRCIKRGIKMNTRIVKIWIEERLSKPVKKIVETYSYHSVCFWRGSYNVEMEDGSKFHLTTDDQIGERKQWRIEPFVEGEINPICESPTVFPIVM